ncbi:putative NBD/HSP70 family sugar kinase [Actinoplanes octamycinicus]|uniref:Putative NBD/HSP70 family sugar kinase n=1 Tax=Actinoplanes octamycinicus TaxID=135948 RepID=A0A7W7M5J5_9ACTN|nr:ROK family transcriptional regulator [Actinoplanes octamycinicus]MBB4737761.1 putative NBD/HSP70 family sugar kinase [Actinoplanes octamycinicus]GIE58061.1 xylose repressor [Actinoplanes octamycinicus]
MTTRSIELLRVVHRSPGVTRADAARRLGVGTGAATELVAKLSRATLLTQAPAAPSGFRGRPTTVLLPHPAGPLALAVAITQEAWRVEAVELGGASAAASSGRHAGSAWPEVRDAVRAAIDELRLRYADRPRAIGVSVPGTVSRAHRVEAVGIGWHDADLTELWPDAEVFTAGNDATLAATAESRRGAAAGASVALHLRIEAGLGGAVVDGGRPVIGARGAAGEFGHMPFGDPAVRCPCGARGCWGVAVDGHQLARLLGEPPPADPISYARRVITAAAAGPGPRLTAVQAVAETLGRGIAGLVNALDADLVTLGGLGADLLATVPDEIAAAYRDGLMSIHRDAPPPIVPAALGDHGPIAGAAEEAWSALLPRLA